MKHVIEKNESGRKRSIIIQHCDMDGYVSGAIAASHIMKTQKCTDIILLTANYNDTFDFTNLNEKTDNVIIVDFSLDVHTMDTLCDNIGFRKVTWIDHHLSAISKYRGHEARNCPGIRAVGLAGCELTWLYYNGFSVDGSSDSESSVILNNNGTLYTIDDLLLTISDKLFPDAVRRAGKFDTFRFTKYYDYINNLVFNYGFNVELLKYDVDDERSMSFWKRFLSMKPENSYSVVDGIMKAGNYIVRHLLQQGKSSILRYAFPCTIHKFPYIKAIAVNTDMKSSFVFEHVKSDYEVGLVFRYNNEGKMEYSIYRLGLNPERSIPVNKIAESFGGGGHADAAGFTTNGVLIVTKVEGE